jgi:hypothetical protein
MQDLVFCVRGTMLQITMETRIGRPPYMSLNIILRFYFLAVDGSFNTKYRIKMALQ